MGVLSAQDEPAPPPVDRATAEKMLESATAVEREVAELVGRPFKTAVKKAVMTKDELRKELARMLEKEFGKGKRERLEAWLRGLGLMSGERDVEQTMTDVLLSQIGGFYDPERQQFFMMVESAAYGDLVNRMMIAHELCHALDDQYVDLASLIRPGGQEPTEDQNYVIGGVVEGSATALMFRWMARAMTDRSALEDAAKMAEQQKDQMEVLLAAPPYFTLLAANYMVGQHFMTKGKGMTALMSGAADGNVVTEVAKAMPRSSEQLLHLHNQHQQLHNHNDQLQLLQHHKLRRCQRQRVQWHHHRVRSLQKSLVLKMSVVSLHLRVRFRRSHQCVLLIFVVAARIQWSV